MIHNLYRRFMMKNWLETECLDFFVLISTATWGINWCPLHLNVLLMAFIVFQLSWKWRISSRRHRRMHTWSNLILDASNRTKVLSWFVKALSLKLRDLLPYHRIGYECSMQRNSRSFLVEVVHGRYDETLMHSNPITLSDSPRPVPPPGCFTSPW